MRKKEVCGILLAGTAGLVPFGTSHAQTATPYGTLAGTAINNRATATYSVNGTTNTVDSNTSTFLVDRKVNLTVVADQSTTTKVSPGDTNVVTRFKVTNNTNATQDIQLFAHQPLDFPIALLNNGDNLDISSIKAVVDDGDGIYDAARDTQTYIDELAPDASRVVYIVGNVPTGSNLSMADVGLEAAVAAGGTAGTKGALLIASDLNLIGQDNDVDVVFADNDSDGLLGPDLARNGRGWAYAAYEVTVNALDISVTKTSTVLSDPVNSLAPKAIPGAVVQYCLTVRNGTLLTAASGINLVDSVPANTTYVPGSLVVGALGLANACIAGGVSIADDGSTTGTYSGSYNAATRTVTATIPTLAGGTAVAASFKVTVN